MMVPMPEVLVVSSCLLGRRCRYDGASKGSEVVASAVEKHRASGGTVVSVCPEQLGGLGTPRPAAELRGGDGAAVLAGAARVEVCEDGSEVTAAFVAGAERALAAAGEPDMAILKARSPSCGCGRTHIDGAVAAGDGVFAALLRRRGVALRTDEELVACPGGTAATDPGSASGTHTTGE
ncbi:MAG: DUF523 domain-containing protein [Myxococcota bacterium]|nr:DUF523 domain-containing protein [Myxococcota bacterium]